MCLNRLSLGDDAFGIDEDLSQRDTLYSLVPRSFGICGCNKRNHDRRVFFIRGRGLGRKQTAKKQSHQRRRGSSHGE